MKNLLDKRLKIKDFLNPDYPAFIRDFYKKNADRAVRIRKYAKKNPEMFSLELAALVAEAIEFGYEVERNRAFANANAIYGEFMQKMLDRLKPRAKAFKAIDKPRA
jgi:hypothetical protein